jgi:hypothetical protein
LASFGPAELLPGPKSGSAIAAGASAPSTAKVLNARAMRFFIVVLLRGMDRSASTQHSGSSTVTRSADKHSRPKKVCALTLSGARRACQGEPTSATRQGPSPSDGTDNQSNNASVTGLSLHAAVFAPPPFRSAIGRSAVSKHMRSEFCLSRQVSLLDANVLIAKDRQSTVRRPIHCTV